MTRIACGAVALVTAAAATLVLLLTPANDVADFKTVRSAWRPSDAYLLDRHGALLDRLRVDFGVRRLEWVPLDKISPALVGAIVDGEDKSFWAHRGIDWLAGMAAARDLILPGRQRGASTISMQLAALIDARASTARGRESWRRKLAQVRIARAIESTWSKSEILEGYLNLLSFRGELQGIAASAQVLAAKSPSGLSLPESLVLAALLPAPNASMKSVAERACARARARKLDIHCSAIRVTAQTLRKQAAAALGPELTAPHVARAMLKRPGAKIRSTLDSRTQRLAQAVLRQHLARMKALNARDGAALIVENATGDVLAYVGSAGPYSRAHEVDGVRALRQAGSTLKPFLYGLALERHYLTAASLLDDSPISLETARGIYLPQNYDRDFKGLVSVRTALASSLNVPAVRALVMLGVQPFRDHLNHFGYGSLKREGDHYGYALALGSAEVSLWEQVQAYRALARGGNWSAIRLSWEDSPAAEVPILRAEAAFIVSDILSDRAARSVTFGLDNHLNTPFWSAVKTGTSKDMRDNWCIGFTSRYTVGVWVGNFEGDSMHDVSGVTGAAPVWAELMTALHANVESMAPVPPPGVSVSLAQFAPAVEAPRPEWFLDRADLGTIAAVPSRNGIARIASPSNGVVIALDPDIPPPLQKVPLMAQAAASGARFRLNGEVIGRAETTQLWSPRAGRHSLELLSAAGAVEDRVDFVVR